MGHKQQPLRSKGEAGGAFVVISGIVRVACESGDGVAFEDAFLGAGLFCLACHTWYNGQKLQVCCVWIRSVVWRYGTGRRIIINALSVSVWTHHQPVSICSYKLF